MRVGVVGAAEVAGMSSQACIIPLLRILVSVRETSADWIKGVEPPEDPALKGKKDPDNGFEIKVNRRNVGKLAGETIVTASTSTATATATAISTTYQYNYCYWASSMQYWGLP